MEGEGPVHRARYRFGRGDLWVLVRAIYAASWTRRSSGLMIFVPVFVGSLWFATDGWPLALARAAVEGDPAAALSLVALVAVFAVLLMAVVFVGPYVIATTSLIGFRKLAIAGKDVEIDIDGHGVKGSIGDIRSDIPWSSIIGLIELDDRLLLKISALEAVTVPERGFPEAQAYAAAAAFIKKRIHHG